MSATDQSSRTARLQLINSWGSLPGEKKGEVAAVDFIKFAESNRARRDYHFSEERPEQHRIDVPTEIKNWTYFYANAPKVGLNVPVPHHPLLKQSGFYGNLSYLLEVSEPFQHVEGLERLHESKLNESFATGGRMVEGIRAALALGRPVLIHGCTTRFAGLSVDVEDPVFSSLVQSPGALLEAQDLIHVPGLKSITFEEFWRHRYNPTRIWNVLDLSSFSLAGRSPYLWGVYDDAGARSRVQTEGPCLLADSPRYSQWAEYGHPFSHSFAHQDASGLSTYATVVMGCTVWFVLQWTVDKVTPELWTDRRNAMTTGTFFELEYTRRPPWLTDSEQSPDIIRREWLEMRDSWEKYRIARWQCIHLQEGMTLIMPPTQLHWVYNPCLTFSTGGHGLLWDCLPLTEVGCRMDRVAYGATNDVHPSMSLIHSALILELPEDVKEAQRIRGRPAIESLVRMVRKPEEYKPVERAGNRRYSLPSSTELHESARKVAETFRGAWDVLDLNPWAFPAAGTKVIPVTYASPPGPNEGRVSPAGQSVIYVDSD